ncbi:MAG: metalloregulator ArsR/SmtB family transcription factor [Anaerolineae bacterium]|nr:metalloregulator ArsR/SmtB family transcription factor [Anaerolineae bacterium]
MADKDFILAPQVKTYEVVLSPFWEALNLVFLLHDYNRYSGIHERLIHLAQSISPELLEQNRKVVEGFWGVIKPKKYYPDYLTFVDDLSQQDPVELRDAALNSVCDYTIKYAKEENLQLERPDPSALLANFDQYAAYLKHFDKHEEFNPEMLREIHTLLNDPPAMKTMVVNHLQQMWDELLEEDIQHTLLLLQESVQAFRNVDLSGLSTMEAARTVTGRDLSSTYFVEMLDAAALVHFVPLSYIAPYVSAFGFGSEVWVLFGARVPEGVKSRSPELSRSELLVRLNALADDTRLRILELLTHGEELFAQDIMTTLELSQSAASRHLRQLSATGYLTERTKQGAKCYRLNTERANDMLNALEVFLLGK